MKPILEGVRRSAYGTHQQVATQLPRHPAQREGGAAHADIETADGFPPTAADRYGPRSPRSRIEHAESSEIDRQALPRDRPPPRRRRASGGLGRRLRHCPVIRLPGCKTWPGHIIRVPPVTPSVGGAAATAPDCKSGIPHGGSSPPRRTPCPRGAAGKRGCFRSSRSPVRVGPGMPWRVSRWCGRQAATLPCWVRIPGASPRPVVQRTGQLSPEGAGARSIRAGPTVVLTLWHQPIRPPSPENGLCSIRSGTAQPIVWPGGVEVATWISFPQVSAGLTTRARIRHPRRGAGDRPRLPLMIIRARRPGPGPGRGMGSWAGYLAPVALSHWTLYRSDTGSRQ